jgi:hypothetical protein
MTTSTSTNGPTCRARHSFRSFALLLSIASASGLIAAPSIAQASSRSAPSAAAICSKVSAASVSKVAGHTLPPPTASSFNQTFYFNKSGKSSLKRTKSFNTKMSEDVTSCTYGSETSTTALLKDVSLEYEVTSRRLTTAELKAGLAQAQKIKLTFKKYHGLGMTAYYWSFTDGGITDQGITGLAGKQEYGAFVYTKATSKSTLAALVRLAEKL